MQDRVWNDDYRSTIVCIDSYTDGVMVGRFYTPFSAEGEPFRSLSRFLIRMDCLLDEMNLPPQSSVAMRSFAIPPEQKQGSPPQKPQKGETATFMVRVLFRQNASWQGSITWLEGRREQSFRSVLELVLLMDSVLSGAEKPG